MTDLYANKPRDYDDRRRWQDAQRAAGLDAECGREVCRTRIPDGKAWVNRFTPLLYCQRCAALINNGCNPGLCRPETEATNAES